MAFRIERQLALSEEKMKCLCELRDQAYDQIAKIMMFTVSWQDLAKNFETIRTDLLEQAKQLALQERKLVEDSNLLELREKETEIKLRRTDEEIQVKETELCLVKMQIEEALEEFSLREKQLDECDIELTSKKQKVEECNRELSLKKEELGLVKTDIEECRKDLRVKKERLNECSYELQMTEKRLDSIRTQVQDFSVEIGSKQKHLNLVQEEIEKCDGVLNFKKKELEECKKEYDLLEQKMSRIRESAEGSKELDSTNLMVCSIKQLIGEYNEELEYKEEEHDEMKNIVDEVAEKVKLKEGELKSIEKSFIEKSEKLYKEEEELDSIRKSKEKEEKKLISLQGAVKHCQEELELEKEQLRSVKLKLNNSNVELNSIKKLIMECSGKLESEERNLDGVKKSLEECCHELATKEVQQGVIHVMCCENLKELQEQKMFYDSLRRTIEEREEELQKREKQLEEKVKMLESGKDIEQLDCSRSNPACSSSGNPLFSASASVKSPELVLHDIVNDPHLTIEEVSNGLQFSSDPAKLVLDVMQVSYFQFQCNESAGFDDCRNVVLLLERLMKMSPSISLQVKEIALQQGLLWKEKLNSKTQNSIEILAFLMFLAVYDLASNFRRDEILVLINAIVHYKQAPGICRALCFMDEIASLTANLIQSKRLLEAARFSKAFELSSKFLPRNILKDHLETIKMDVLAAVNGSSSFQGEIRIMEKAAVALKTFWEYVVDCQLESIFPLEICTQYIAASLKTRLQHSFFDSPQTLQLPREGLMTQQPMRPCMVSASNPSHRHPFPDTGKRPRLDSMVSESHQGCIPPQYGYQDGSFHNPN